MKHCKICYASVLVFDLTFVFSNQIISLNQLSEPSITVRFDNSVLI